jgi:hypothetical protein
MSRAGDRGQVLGHAGLDSSRAPYPLTPVRPILPRERSTGGPGDDQLVVCRASARHPPSGEVLGEWRQNFDDTGALRAERSDAKQQETITVVVRLQVCRGTTSGQRRMSTSGSAAFLAQLCDVCGEDLSWPVRPRE